MGVLRRSDTDKVHELPATTLIGRSRSCDIHIDAADVSGQHAVLRWTGSVWELRDLQSRNGTYVDGQRIDPGATVVVPSGATLQFARRSSAWIIADASEPQPLARCLESGVIARADDGLLVLPSPQQPQTIIYQDAAGRWCSETEGELSQVADRGEVLVDGQIWRLYLSGQVVGTQDSGDRPVTLAELRFRFAHSRDEEYVELRASGGGCEFNFESHADHYPLLILARARLADSARQMEPGEQGWLARSELLDMLKMDRPHLNISIHRARQRLLRAGIVDAESLVQRRRRHSELRLGLHNLEVVAL